MDNVKKETIIRTIVLMVAIINQILTSVGKCPLPVEDSQLSEILSALITAGASIWAWWKNNSFTKSACEADKLLAEKRGLKCK